MTAPCSEKADEVRTMRQRKPMLMPVDKLLTQILPAGVVVEVKGDTVKVTVNPHDSPDKFKSYGGSDQMAANVALIHAVLSIMPRSTDLWVVGQRVAGGLAHLQALQPTDGVEGMIATQAVVMHLMGLEAARRSMVAEQQFEVAARLRKDAANMMRGAVEMVSALDRRRGKTVQQKVVVEHVNIHAGGQAIVGAVQGGQQAIERQSVPLALEDLVTVPAGGEG